MNDCLSPHHLQGGAPKLPLRRTFLRVVTFYFSILLISPTFSSASVGEVTAFRLRQCSQDGQTCYEVHADRAEHSWDPHQYVFRKATLTIIDRAQSLIIKQILHGDNGYMDTSSHSLVLRSAENPDQEILINLRSTKILKFGWP